MAVLPNLHFSLDFDQTPCSSCLAPKFPAKCRVCHFLGIVKSQIREGPLFFGLPPPGRRRRRRLMTMGALSRSLSLPHPGTKYPVRGPLTPILFLCPKQGTTLTLARPPDAPYPNPGKCLVVHGKCLVVRGKCLLEVRFTFLGSGLPSQSLVYLIRVRFTFLESGLPS